MQTRRTWCLPLTVFLAGSLGAAAAPPDAALGEKITALVKQLGDADAKSRQEAVTKLRLLARRVDRIGGQRVQRGDEFEPKVKGLVPHLIRMIWRRDFRFLLPLCALGGAVLVVLADLVSRVVLASSELPIGAFTAVLGVPFFLSLLRRGR